MLNHRVARRVVIIEIDSDVTVAAGGVSHARFTPAAKHSTVVLRARLADCAVCMSLSCWSSSDKVLGLDFCLFKDR